MPAKRLTTVIIALGLIGASAGPGFSDGLPKRASSEAGRRGPIRVWMRDVDIYPYDDAPAHVTDLSGSVTPTRPGGLVVFDDVTSYGIKVASTELHMRPGSLTVLMNRHILPAANGPIKHVDISFGAGVLLIKGVMVKAGAPIPFSATATAAPNADGDMAISITKMTAAGIVPKGLMDALGLQMSKVAQPHNKNVFYIVGDTMVVPIVSMFPPPEFSGRLRSVTVTPTEMIAVIGQSGRTDGTTVAAKSFIHFRGGALKFAKLTMQDVDLTIVPKTASGPLGFSPANYYRQMVAGFTAPEPDRGLTAHVPSYTGMIKVSPGAEPAKPPQ